MPHRSEFVTSAVLAVTHRFAVSRHEISGDNGRRSLSGKVGVLFSHSSARHESGRTLTLGRRWGGNPADRQTDAQPPKAPTSESVYSEDIPAPLRTALSLSAVANKTEASSPPDVATPPPLQ